MKISTANKLKPDAVEEALTKLLSELRDDVQGLHSDTQRELLIGMINLLDDVDQDDNFGTEGWRHALDFEH